MIALKFEKKPTSMNITLSPIVTLQLTSEGASLVDRNGEVYYELDEAGARLWSLLAENSNFDAVLAQLLTEFESDEETLSRELRELLEDMAQADLVAWEFSDDI